MSFLPMKKKTIDASDNTVLFNEASTRENINSEESLSTLFGKIKKFFSDLKTVAFTGKYSDLSDKGTVAIANGGTGATTRLEACKALTNEALASPTYVVGLTGSWANFGYTSIAQLKTTLGISTYSLKSTTKSSLAAAAMGSTASRQYAVGLDSSGYLSVNVPWQANTAKMTATTLLSRRSVAAGGNYTCTDISSYDLIGINASQSSNGALGDIHIYPYSYITIGSTNHIAFFQAATPSVNVYVQCGFKTKTTFSVQYVNNSNPTEFPLYISIFGLKVST